VQDSGSGLANPAQATLTLATDVRLGQTDRHASTNSVIVCDAVHNCARVGPVHADVDRTRATSGQRPAFAVAGYAVVARAAQTSRTGVVVDFPLPVASGSGTTVSCNPAPGSSEPAGTTNGSCTATSASGMSVTIPLQIITTVVPSLQPGGVAEAGHRWAAGAAGFAPDAPVVLSIDGQVLGQVPADTRGDALTSFRVPVSVGAGDHELTMAGTGPSGATVVVSDRLSVARVHHDAAPSFGGRHTVLGRLALAGAEQPLAAPAAAAVPSGETFGGGASQHFAAAAQPRAAPSGGRSWWWLILVLGAGLAAVSATVTALRRRRTHLNSGGTR
jgi:hypothetical protein